MPNYTPHKQMVDVFCGKLQHNFHNYCKEYQLDSSLDNFLTYLIDRNLINRREIRRYAIAHTFEEHYKDQCQYSKTQSVGLMARRFNVSERSVWSALQQVKKG